MDIIEDRKCPACNGFAKDCFSTKDLSYSITCLECGFEYTAIPKIDWQKYHFLCENGWRLFNEDKIEILAYLMSLPTAPRDDLRRQIRDALSHHRGPLPQSIVNDKNGEEILREELSGGYGTYCIEDKETKVKTFCVLPDEDDKRAELIEKLIEQRKTIPELGITIQTINDIGEIVEV